MLSASCKRDALLNVLVSRTILLASCHVDASCNALKGLVECQYFMT